MKNNSTQFPSRFACLAFVMTFCVAGCASDSPPERDTPSKPAVSLVFEEEAVPGPATSTLMAEAERRPLIEEAVASGQRGVETKKAPVIAKKAPVIAKKDPVVIKKATPLSQENLSLHSMASAQGKKKQSGVVRENGSAVEGDEPTTEQPVVSSYGNTWWSKSWKGGKWERTWKVETEEEVVSVKKRERKPRKTTFQAGDIEVLRAVTCANVDQRRPVEVKETFTTKDDKVWVWLQLKNKGPATTVDLVWKKDGQRKWKVDLNVGHGRRWRTWARKSIHRVNVGDWTVEVHDAAGNVLDTLAFNVKSSSAGEISRAD